MLDAQRRMGLLRRSLDEQQEGHRRSVRRLTVSPCQYIACDDLDTIRNAIPSFFALVQWP